MRRMVKWDIDDCPHIVVAQAVDQHGTGSPADDVPVTLEGQFDPLERQSNHSRTGSRSRLQAQRTPDNRGSAIGADNALSQRGMTDIVLGERDPAVFDGTHAGVESQVNPRLVRRHLAEVRDERRVFAHEAAGALGVREDDWVVTILREHGEALA